MYVGRLERVNTESRGRIKRRRSVKGTIVSRASGEVAHLGGKEFAKRQRCQDKGQDYKSRRATIGFAVVLPAGEAEIPGILGDFPLY